MCGLSVFSHNSRHASVGRADARVSRPGFWAAGLHEAFNKGSTAEEAERRRRQAEKFCTGDDATMKKTTLAMLILCASLALPAQAGYEEGLAAFLRGDYATALKEWRPLANAGNPFAQAALGVMYSNGHGVPLDHKEAVKWSRLAAEQGNTDAQHNLGLMYYVGKGVPRDHREAAKWFRLAAEKGDAIAQYNLGVMYANGHGVPQDHREAVKWYRLAAEQGNTNAQYNLGLMYAKGEGVPQDHREAAKWFRLAAEKGDADAQNALGSKYRFGIDVPRDKVLAYALFSLSAAGDPFSDNPATRNRDTIAKEMTPREIEAGQALTRALAQPGNFGKALDAYLYLK
jgi:hypothetical protein